MDAPADFVPFPQVDSSAMTLLLSYVKLTDSTFAAAVLCIAFNPLFWNVVARWEHKTRVLSRVCGSPYTACYCLGAVILLLNFIRSDYFGILKEEKVTSFPFNVMDNPMYWGSTACYLGWSIISQKKKAVIVIRSNSAGGPSLRAGVRDPLPNCRQIPERAALLRSGRPKHLLTKLVPGAGPGYKEAF
uniref:phosphatidyl-N-methylethanolamine N-methyltransferase n=1 Tax=Chelonoidis abingdonii TaxID=106734 RepID=A0A8C0JAL9_CHEAB